MSRPLLAVEGCHLCAEDPEHRKALVHVLLEEDAVADESAREESISGT